MAERTAGGSNIGGARPDVETSSPEYARRFSGPAGEFFLRRQESVVLEALPADRGLSVLDVGGGHAQMAPALVERGFRVTVTGSDPVCVERLRPLYESGRVSFQVCDFLDLPFRDRTFDVVLSLRLLAHVREWRRLIAELTRCARTTVVVDYPDLRSANLVGGLLFGLKRSVEGNTRPFLRFRRRDIRACFEANGFAAPEFEPELFLPMALHRMLGAPRVSRALEALAQGVGATRIFGSPVVAVARREEHA